MPVRRSLADDLSSVTLGVVCPMANEEAAAVAFAEEVLDQCRQRDFASVTFFAVLDEASRDATLELMRELAAKRRDVQVVWSPENRTVVDAYLRGYREALDAGCAWILEIDAGYSHQPQDIPQFFDRMVAGYDCVFGSRFCPGGSMAETSLKRRLISRGGNALARVLLGTKGDDVTSGFELFRRAALADVLDKGIRSRGPFFQTEIKARCRGWRVAEVPIRYRGASHSVGATALADSFTNLGRLFALRLRGQL